jgi:NAD(P)-dependent dehydrogenase (short-subunit alcohol dehydrogenase family)
MSRFANKIAVVIGGGGIGAAISQRFAAEGAHVYATSRTAVDSAPDASSGNGEGGVRAVRADARSLADLEQVFARVRSEAGRIDVLVVNAGVSEFATLDGVGEDHFDRIFGLNVRSLLFAAQGGLDLMQAGATIVLVGSIVSVAFGVVRFL